VKVGLRTPSIKKSLKARTTGRAKRAVKRATNPLYGKKGMGVIKDPKRAAKNAVYKRTTVGVSDIAGLGERSNTNAGEIQPKSVSKAVWIVLILIALSILGNCGASM